MSLALLGVEPGPAAPAGPYICDAANFDGTNDYMHSTAALTGQADGKLLTGSLWLKRGAISTTQVVLANGQGLDRWLSFVAADDKLKIEFPSSANGNVLNVKTGTVFSDTTAWHHVCFCFDMADVAKRFIYVDDAADTPTYTSYTNTDIDLAPSFGSGFYGAGARPNGSNKLNGDLADVWVSFTYFDISVAANRRKFIDGSGKPVDLGSDGSTPTGVAPIFFRHLSDGEAAANFAINRGTGGADMTITGALTTAATSPTD